MLWNLFIPNRETLPAALFHQSWKSFLYPNREIHLYRETHLYHETLSTIMFHQSWNSFLYPIVKLIYIVKLVSPIMKPNFISNCETNFYIKSYPILFHQSWNSFLYPIVKFIYIVRLVSPILKLIFISNRETLPTTLFHESWNSYLYPNVKPIFTIRETHFSH